ARLHMGQFSMTISAVAGSVLGDNQQRDQLRIVTGAPGSGKSSSAKVLAQRVAYSDYYNVFFVPLQGRDVTLDIGSIIDKQLEFTRASGTLTTNPVDALQNDYKPLLLIFDGLDEVKRPDLGGVDTTRKFVSNLRAWLTQHNTQSSDVLIRAIVLGRPQAAQEAVDEISMNPRHVLNTAQISAIEKADLTRSGDADIEIVDPRNLQSKDQRQHFWQRCAPLFDGAELPPDGLFGSELQELTKEPLLFYLLFVSGFAGERWRDAAENRNRVYEEIFTKIHERDVHDKTSSLKDGVQDVALFFTLMECLGLAAWWGGGRTGDDLLFGRLRDQVYCPERTKDFSHAASADLRNVALQIYTQQGADEAPGYEFIHKSFAEYLTSRALVRAAIKWAHRYEDIWNDFLLAWCRLTSSQSISLDLLRFIKDEMRLYGSKFDDADRTADNLRSLCTSLADAYSTGLSTGLPVHKAEWIDVTASNWRDLEKRQVNAETALLCILSAAAAEAYREEDFETSSPRAWTSGPIKIESQSARTLKLLNLRISAYPQVSQYRSDAFDRFNFHGQIVSRAAAQQSFPSFALFSYCRFSGFYFNQEEVRSTLFEDCEFDHTQFYSMTIKGCTFRRCNFSHLNWHKVKFEDSSFIDCNLSSISSISESDLSGLTGLTIEMLGKAYDIDESTKIPESLTGIVRST
ncbi:pentapeptide repeat-containing protein, partial [Sulfitobacter sp. 1A13730]|uniref:NACHT domain-containing protein n=1 Tax=Sulfitobacter sp. 1A13730 TaxID=3368569 RepID=UPI0037475A08